VSARPSKTERVRCIARKMCSGGWVAGVTVHELAADWKMSPRTLEYDASEASRQIRNAVNDDGELRARALGVLEGTLADLERLRERFAESHPVVSLRALETKVRAVAVMLGETGRRGKPEDPTGALPPMPPQELVRILAEKVFRGATDDELAKHGLARIGDSRAPSSAAEVDATGSGGSPR
jgi:hypothetical protein